MSLELQKLSDPKTQRDVCRTFYGYDARLNIKNGEFSMTENTSSIHYPYLSPKSPSGRVRKLTDPHGLFALNGLAWVDGQSLYYNGSRIVGLTLNTMDKTLIGFGAYIVIWPDKVMYNTSDGTVTYMEVTNTTTVNTKISLCSMDGTAYDQAVQQDDEPSDPSNGDLWIDSSGTTWELKIYSQSQGAWNAVSTVYCKIASEGIGAGLKQYDAVDIEGIEDSSLSDLKGSHVIYEVDENGDWIVVVGTCAAWKAITQSAAVTVSKTIPDMDYICEHENRLWGCSSANHEVYCSALGDPTNFNRYLGISTDSYAATVGSPGDFTGCIAHGGYVLFFKEDRVHKMYGSYPSAFQLTESPLRGVEAGSSNSLHVVNSTLYYKSREDVNSFASYVPTSISANLGTTHYKNAWSGSYEGILYINLEDEAGDHQLFSYDTINAVWNRIGNINARYMSTYGNDMYYIADDGYIWSMYGSFPAECADENAALEKPVHWYAETGDLSLDSQSNSYVAPMSPDARYMSKLQVRADVDQGSLLIFSLQYDTDDDWHEVFRYSAKGKRSLLVPIIPRRADTVRMRIEGIGPAVISSFAKTVEKAGFRS